MPPIAPDDAGVIMVKSLDRHPSSATGVYLPRFTGFISTRQPNLVQGADDKQKRHGLDCEHEAQPRTESCPPIPSGLTRQFVVSAATAIRALTSPAPIPPHWNDLGQPARRIRLSPLET